MSTEVASQNQTHVGGSPGRSLVIGGFFLVIVFLGFGTALLIKSQVGIHLGDSPAYIMQAQSYAHLTPHVTWAIHADTNVNYLGYPLKNYPEIFGGPRGIVSPFEPGLGILLVPFVSMGHFFVSASIGMAAFSAAGLLVLHRRATLLAGLQVRGQLLFAIVLLSPAVLLASTQIYPDFLSGLLVACALTELALAERDLNITWTSAAIVTVATVMLPWLQIKNLVPAIILAVSWLVISVLYDRHRLLTLQPYVVAILSVFSWIVLLTYNVRYLGHLLGLPEPPVRASRRGLEYTLGLLFDRHQGLFVQNPFAVFGIVGIWIAFKKLPVAVVSTVLSLGTVLVLNGTYVINPYGGDSLSGRFMWTLLSPLLAWSVFVIKNWERSDKMLVPLVAVASIWAYEALPIIAGSHIYYNVYGVVGADTGSKSGWWWGISSLFPTFFSSGHIFGAPSWRILAELGVLGALVGLYLLKARSAAQVKPAHVASGRSRQSWRM